MSNTEVIFSTSFDDKYPPTNVLNSSTGMFWSTTGLFPQEIVLSCSQAKSISEIIVMGYNIKRLSIETCENDSAVKFSVQCDIANIPLNSGGISTIPCKFSSKSVNKIIKVIIQESHGLFCTINSINIK
jgi:hypothetical protein